MLYIEDKMRKALECLQSMSVVSRETRQDFRIKECGFKQDNVIPAVDDSWDVLQEYMSLSAKDQHYWIIGKVHTPAVANDDQFVTLDFVNPAGNPCAHTILYLNGEMTQGLDANHSATILEPDTDYDVALYAYYESIHPCRMMMPVLKINSSLVQKLYYDLLVPFETSQQILEKGTGDYKMIMKHLELAANKMDLRVPHSAEFYASLQDADDYIMSEFYEKECGKTDLAVNCLGHSHMDIAWRWTVEQTREKAQRTFSSVIYLMKKYPEYKFMMTQPQLYQLLREGSPEMYEQVKERIAEGRLEVDGAMWLEADGNLPSGESFIRQVLFGKKFFREEFGVNSRTLWIPDVFGYSAALPQILRKSGVDRFVTGKISWNDTNRMPNDTFYWQGIDGTEIFTNFLTTKDHDIYNIWPVDKSRVFVQPNGHMDAQEINSTYEVYRNKEFNDQTLHTFGHGDGGGGPTWEMLERQRRFAYGMPGMPKTRMNTLDNFLNTVKANFDESCQRLKRTPKWVGELYLEYHRGTYTSIAKNKKNNRDCEFLMMSTEFANSLNYFLYGEEYPQKELNVMWENMLLNQFHDIIPGSSIKKVYDVTDEEYALIRKNAGALEQAALNSLADKVDSKGGYLVVNTNSFPVNGVVDVDGTPCVAKDVPAMGYRVMSDFYAENSAEIGEKSISNKYFDLKLDDCGNLISVYDKKADREIVKPGESANLLRAYEDMPIICDAWEITHYYKQKSWDLNDVESITPFRNGAKAGLRVVRKFMSSTFTQDIVVYDDIPRIDFETTIDWKETHLLLKSLFPMNIKTDKVTAEIQFGHVDRPTHSNTTWDEAKFEMCMHKWVDMSDSGYGVSLLNDCKYGFSADENVIGLTLLKCATEPNPVADQEVHHLTYSIYAHEGNVDAGETVRQAYMLNQPLKVVPAAAHAGILPAEKSFLYCDEKNVVIETVKKCEEGEGLIVRLYDAGNRTTKAHVHFDFPVGSVALCDMQENEESVLEVKDNTVTIPVGNFEIITLKLSK